MRNVYIGPFPSPYGGVTRKNEILFKEIKNYKNIIKINLSLIKRKNIFEFFKLFYFLFFKKNVFIIAASGKYRKYLTKILYYFNHKSLQKSLFIVMGGATSVEKILKDKNYKRYIKKYKVVYVETVTMKEIMINNGIDNVSVFPNCRNKPIEELPIKKTNMKKIRILFFSQVSKEKGVDIILDAVKILNNQKKSKNLIFHIYGEIVEDYKDEFLRNIKKAENIEYKGVYNQESQFIYSKLNEYDLHLFPTKYKTEGVPGILVETKIAGIPSIVSNNSYNADIVEHGETGLVLTENNATVLAQAIDEVTQKDKVLDAMKYKAKLSANDYYIDTYVPDIIDYLM